MRLISRSLTLNIWFKQLPSPLKEQFQRAPHLPNVPQHLYFSLNELPRSTRRILSHKNNPWLIALDHISSHYYLKKNLNAWKHKVAHYSEEGILDIKRNIEHKILKQCRNHQAGGREVSEASRFTAFCGWVVTQDTFEESKGCGAVWKMLRVFNQKFYDKAAWWSLGN